MVQQINNEPPAVNVREELSRLATRNLCAFAAVCDTAPEDKRFKPSAFHVILGRILYDTVILRKKKRLIINVPPRHGKSRLTSTEAVALLLGHRPDTEVAVTSYGQNLALDASRAVRDRIQKNERYRKLFPHTRIRKDGGAVEEWFTTAGGRLQAVGVEGGLTGKGVDLLIVDDPHKDRAEAESPTQREKVWDWFKSTSYTRLSPQGVIVVIMTRWHPDDLAGRLTDPKRVKELNEGGAEDEVFEVVNFPAIAEPKDPMGRPEGAALWPERWTEKVLQSRKAVVGSYEWDALFRGKPRVRSANYGLLDKIEYCKLEEVPKEIEWGRVWDLATTNKEESDFNVGTRGCFDKKNQRLYIIDIHRQRSRWLATKQAIRSKAEQDGQGTRVRLEGVGGFEALYDETREMLRGKNVVSMFKPKADKFTRALPWIALAEAGKLFLVEAPWNTAFTDELVTFPNGEHDDQIDTISGLYEWLNSSTKLLFA